MADHAKVFGASGFERLMLCPGSAVLTAGAPRRSTENSAEGTAIHAAAADVLQGELWPIPGQKVEADGFTFSWDADMEECGQAYVDYVQGLDGDFLMVEQRVSFGAQIGVDDPEDGFGTADAIVGKGTELIVVDLKCGRGVEVEAGGEEGPNPQLALYAIGALAEMQGLVGDFETVRLVIVQPRNGGVKEYVLTVGALRLWAAEVAELAANQVRHAQGCHADGFSETFKEVYLQPTEKGCKFCAAKATCPALRDAVAGTVSGSAPASADEFLDLQPDLVGNITDDSAPWLSAALSKVDLIEDWCKAVRAEADRRLSEGQPVPGYKLVQGKKGNRKWADDLEAETALKLMRVKTEHMYNFKVISPPQAEKLAKAKVIGPRQWPKLQALITQSEGGHHVAPESDPRPAITVAISPDDFI